MRRPGGTTVFSQTEHLDRWNADGRIHFLFGYDCHANLVNSAEKLPSVAWRTLQRPPRYTVATQQRRRPDQVKEAIVKQRLFDEVRYLFYITNDWVREADEIVFCANDRCDQENLLAQLKSGCRALAAPVDNLESNWAYMVMTALAWDLKAWWALLLPEGRGGHQEQYRAEKLWVLGLEFKTFLQAFVRLPCQIVRSGRRLVYRPWARHRPLLHRASGIRISLTFLGPSSRLPKSRRTWHELLQ